MITNQISRIVKMLGVELKEDFKIKGFGDNTYFHFNEQGLVLNNPSANIDVNEVLCNLLNGNLEIIKVPWKPKYGELYYSFNEIYNKWFVCAYYWSNKPHEYALLNQGWVFKTVQEAKAVLEKVKDELGVETLRSYS